MSFIYQVPSEKLPPMPVWFCAPKDERAVLTLRHAAYLGRLMRRRGSDKAEICAALLDVGFDAAETGLRHGEVKRAFREALFHVV
jgi:hypothetical protein